MRSKAIKRVLFSLTCLSAFPGLGLAALPKNDLHLIEELPPEARVIVYDHVLSFLKEHPQLVNEFETIAIDEKGTVYVLDKEMAAVRDIGNPSCIGSN